MSFSLDWVDEFNALDTSVKKQILAKLKDIERSASWPHEALKGRQFRGLYKIRVGDYRLLYRLVDGEVFDFLVLGHRREVCGG